MGLLFVTVFLKAERWPGHRGCCWTLMVNKGVFGTWNQWKEHYPEKGTVTRMVPTVAFQHLKEWTRKMERQFTRAWSKKRNTKPQVCPSAEWNEALTEGWGAALPELSHLSLMS